MANIYQDLKMCVNRFKLRSYTQLECEKMINIDEKAFGKLVKHGGVQVDNLQRVYGNGSMIHIPNHFYKALLNIVRADMAWVDATAHLAPVIDFNYTELKSIEHDIQQSIDMLYRVQRGIENFNYHINKISDLMNEVDDPDNVREAFGFETVTHAFITIYGDRCIMAPIVNDSIEKALKSARFLIGSEFISWWMTHHDRRQWDTSTDRFEL